MIDKCLAPFYDITPMKPSEFIHIDIQQEYMVKVQNWKQ